MYVSRGVSNVEIAVRKLSSRFRRPPQVSRAEWPVVSATRPLFYFIRIFGLAPYEISQDHFEPGSYGVIYSLFCIFVHTYLAYLVLGRFASVRRGQVILDITETAKKLIETYFATILRVTFHQVVFNYFIALLNIVMAVWTRKDFIEVLNIVRKFDLILRDLGFPRKERAAKVWVWTAGACTAFVWIMVNSMGMIAFAEPWSTNMGYLFNYLAASLTIIKFSSIVLLLGQRFRQLNNVAQRNQGSITTEQKCIAIDLKVIQQLHNILMNASESLNSQYSWSLLLWLINLCVHSVSNIYFMISWIMVAPVDWAETQWAFLSCITWWLVAFIAQLLLLHIACDFTSSEANNIGLILIGSKSPTLNRNDRLETSLYFIHRRLNFSAAGCFYVNLPLLRSISAILTTYIVLLMQFQD